MKYQKKLPLHFVDMNTEFENLLRLLESTDEANVRVGLQIARNYTEEIEAHFGYSYQDLEALFDFLMQYKAWDFETAFWEIEHLDLRYKGFIEFPKIVVLLSKLKKINLSHNQLTTLPVEVGKLQKLRELDLGDNQLKTLPDEIGQLRSLVYMGLSRNQFQTLPPEIGLLQNLEELHLFKNPLQSLLEEFCNLKNTGIFIGGTPENMFIPEKLREMGILRFRLNA